MKIDNIEKIGQSFIAIFIAASLVLAGWTIDDRIRQQTNNLTAEIRSLQQDVKDLSKRITFLEGKIEALDKNEKK